MRGRLARTLLIVAAAAALATAGIAVNFLLLRYADSSNDPVGKVSPRATIIQPTSPPTTRTDGEADHGKGDGKERDD